MFSNEFTITIEFIIDNPAYERFNKLFLQTIAPYFKVGMNEYISGNHYGFPFDDAIDNINKSINEKTLGYENVVNFENYLNNSWILSYFDNTLKLSEGWNYSEYLVRRSQVIVAENRYRDSEEIDERCPIKVYYFPKNGVPRDMEFGTNGRFKRTFDPGFFDESTVSSFTLSRLERN